MVLPMSMGCVTSMFFLLAAMHMYSSLIKLISFSLCYGYSSLRTFPLTSSEAVAKIVRYELCLSVYYHYCTFSAVWHAETAAIALIFIDVYYFSYCHFIYTSYVMFCPYKFRLWLPLGEHLD